MRNMVFIKCVQCGTVNRVHKNRLPVCGKCGNALDARRCSYDVLVNLSEETFEQEVLKSRIPVIVDCWAPWCAPCNTIEPMMEKLVSDFRGRLKVARLNTDQNAPIAAQYEIKTLPTLLIFKEGILVDRFTGAVSEPDLDDLVDKWL